MKKEVFLVMVLLMISCQPDSEYHTVTIGKKYSIALPADMVRAVHLNDSASLQYQNARQEIYATVFEKSKTGLKKRNVANPNFQANLDGFVADTKAFLENTISYAKFSEVGKTKINGLKSRQFSLSGIVDDYSLYYEFAFIEGNDRYYEVVVWTEKSKKSAAVEKMKHIIASFKELKNRGKS